ncbi:hypothetical protein LTR53_009734 [Teratosphaeriaceae sp. CCFEE 6253]|nr:hypothetical protein LTR53_009734 [Teratosphaeriaceae sp. CCFEE 6253]
MLTDSQQIMQPGSSVECSAFVPDDSDSEPVMLGGKRHRGKDTKRASKRTKTTTTRIQEAQDHSEHAVKTPGRRVRKSVSFVDIDNVVAPVSNEARASAAPHGRIGPGSSLPQGDPRDTHNDASISWDRDTHASADAHLPSSSTSNPHSNDQASTLRELVGMKARHEKGPAITPNRSAEKHVKKVQPVETLEYLRDKLTRYKANNTKLLQERLELQAILDTAKRSSRRDIQRGNYQIILACTSLVKDTNEMFSLLDKIKMVRSKMPGPEGAAKVREMSLQMGKAKNRIAKAIEYDAKAVEAQMEEEKGGDGGEGEV